MLSIATAWAGTQTITISHNDGQFESSDGVYSASKGGVTISISGGLNNPNYLLLKRSNTVTFKSANFAIKEIVFHCLDDYEEGNNDVYYWGPTTMNVMTNASLKATPGKYEAPYNGNSYDGRWVSSFSGSYSSTFNGTTRTHTSYSGGFPAGNTLTFESLGKAIRFSSIDIVIEKENGDIYELVTNSNQLNTTDTYMLVGRMNATTVTGYAMSVNTTGNSATDNIKSTAVDLLNDGWRVKANDEVQFIKLESSGDNNHPYCLKAGTNYIRSQSDYQEPQSNNRGYCLTKVASKPSSTSYINTRILFGENGSMDNNWEYYARIKYEFCNSNYRIAHNNDLSQFRNLYYNNNRQRVFLYKPAQQYDITTEVAPDASFGSISLRDGVIVSSTAATAGKSQFLETVSFLVNAADGYKIENISIQPADGSVVEPESVTLTTNGTLYTFVMPAADVKIVAEFSEVVYHDVTTVVLPNSNYGNIWLTQGYVVQQNQVKSFEGENIVFNVTSNPKDADNEASGSYELYSVTVTNSETGENIHYTYADGNYSFTMPDAPVTITATFIFDNGSPLYLLGTANGNSQWHTYGPRFNYDEQTDEYYIDTYFTGTGKYGDADGDAYGYFSVTWKVDLNDNWNNINGGNWRGVPGTDRQEIDENTSGSYLWYGSAYENNSFKIPAGIYRIYVGTQASQDKGNLNNNELKIEKYPVSLSLDPAGGSDAASATEVAQGNVVTLAGDLYSKIKAINPNEADENFFYTAHVTTGSTTTTQIENAGDNTTDIATLDAVNDPETVTHLEGYNYLGWIVAENTAYYKVISTPLSWIEENGKTGKTYIVADDLLGVYARDGRLWAKDLGNRSIVKSEKQEADVDYMESFRTFMAKSAPDGMRSSRTDWDQSNWVELNFGESTAAPAAAAGFVGKLIKAGTVKGSYADSRNYLINLSATPEVDGSEEYDPNYYSPTNFMCMNNTHVVSNTRDKTFYFLNPKIQEYALVTFAVWKGDNKFVVAAKDDSSTNADDLNGAFTVDWSLNFYGNQAENLNEIDRNRGPQAYIFHAIVRVPDTAAAPARIVGKDCDPTADYVIFPLDLQANDNYIVTAVTDVTAAGAGVKRVEYVNPAGMCSSMPWQGVNIVVTHLDNGTIQTSKMIR